MYQVPGVGSAISKRAPLASVISRYSQSPSSAQLVMSLPNFAARSTSASPLSSMTSDGVPAGTCNVYVWKFAPLGEPPMAASSVWPRVIDPTVQKSHGPTPVDAGG